MAPIDVEKTQLDTFCGESFDPSKLESNSPKMRSAVISALKEIAIVSNSNLKRNADALIFNENFSDKSIEWLEGFKLSIPEKFKLSY